MNCFGNGKPNLTNRDYAYNKKSEVRYNHIAHLAHNNKCQTHNGKTQMDCSGFLVNTHSFESLLSLTYGEALCAPCDLSSNFLLPVGQHNCICEIPITSHLIDTIIDSLALVGIPVTPAELALGGIGPTHMTLPWNILRSPDGWNASTIVFDASGDTVITLCDPSGAGSSWIYDLSTNVLDNPATLDGSGVCIENNHNLFGGPCAIGYYPPGTFAFNIQEFLDMWVLAQDGNVGIAIQFFIDALKNAGYGKRPETTVDNYLQPVNGFHYPGNIRFFLTSIG